MVGVAQLVEHLVVAQVAVGSSPITHPIKQKRRVLPGHGVFFGPVGKTAIGGCRNADERRNRLRFCAAYETI